MTNFQTCGSISQVDKIIGNIVEGVTNISLSTQLRPYCYECEPLTKFLTSWLSSMAIQLVVQLSTIPWFLVFYYIFPNSPTFLRM
jgi:hypothetical protein